MKRTELENKIQDYLISEGWEADQFNVISANIPDGGSCNLTYVIADVIKEYNGVLIQSLGEPTSDNEYILKTDSRGKWQITHKHVGSGEPFLQFLNNEPVNE